MQHYQKTFKKNKTETENVEKQHELEIPILNTNVIQKKEYVFLVAKTWGAAKSFYDKTELHRLHNRGIVKEVKFLKDESQLVKEMDKNNTLIILLRRYEENKESFELAKFCIKKNFDLLVYNAV